MSEIGRTTLSNKNFQTIPETKSSAFLYKEWDSAEVGFCKYLSDFDPKDALRLVQWALSNPKEVHYKGGIPKLINAFKSELEDCAGEAWEETKKEIQQLLTKANTENVTSGSDEETIEIPTPTPTRTTAFEPESEEVSEESSPLKNKASSGNTPPPSSGSGLGKLLVLAAVVFDLFLAYKYVPRFWENKEVKQLS